MNVLVIAAGACLGILAAVGLIYLGEYLIDKIKVNE
jgi:hypothetical protein